MANTRRRAYGRKRALVKAQGKRERGRGFSRRDVAWVWLIEFLTLPAYEKLD